ncbi:Hsp20 family protein [Sulfitobacter sp. JBTF-M27]|uniref:Hsp20 family protein n=1 Tax=Sulfitobacter sediminilitoris TaxID=2698830 RepID=A0A6P0CJN7_9RHOB|nr:Hsp20/alpha crystallin family protein [Sulfitobacter sediminilitoris]NEK25195.1 Hsp20 family protein [Sulfitobacter sediminilitoris]
MVESNQSASLWPHLYEPFSRMGTKLKSLFAPASDASSSDNVYRISVELPGVSEDDIELSAENGLLTVSGEKMEETEEQEGTWYFSERQYGAFRRSFRMPEDADIEQTEAHMKDGVLSITVPRRAPAESRGKKIAVKKA